MGDDLQDLPVLRRAGFSAAPADAAAEVRAAVHWISASAGGRGAARECIEHVMRAQGLWAAAVAEFLPR
jgi:3-deoxy-D-manno-octulosonate 8-phosphate phosphatase (KDO 8-P phosphatase)